MSKNIVLGLVILIAVAIGSYFVFHKDAVAPENTAAQTSSPAPGQVSEPPAPTTATIQTVAATIMFSNSGFSPATTTVKSGGSITIKNSSSSELDFDSDPHPVHTDDTDLNAGNIAAGESKTITVTKKGAFGFHNHLDPSQNGKIVIE